MELTDAGHVDDPAAADGGPRRGERRHLGPARPAVPGAGRSRPAARQRRHAGRRSLQAAADAAALGAGGFVDTPNQRLAVRHVSPHRRRRRPGRAPSSPSADGAPLRLGDVADVADGYPPPIGDAVINDGPGPAADRREAAVGQHARGDARASRRRSSELRPGLRRRGDRPDHLPARHVHRACRSTTSRTRCSSAACWWSSILVAFLFDWRTALISLTAIPLSLRRRPCSCCTARGGTLNTMVLAGLVIALGEVVDDAIIDVENIVRRLRLNRGCGQPASRPSASCSTPRSRCAAPWSTPA